MTARKEDNVNELQERISELTHINAMREQMLRKLWGLGANFPDDDLRTLYEWLKEETRRRVNEAEKEIGAIEAKVEMEVSA